MFARSLGVGTLLPSAHGLLDRPSNEGSSGILGYLAFSAIPDRGFQAISGVHPTSAAGVEPASQP